MSNSFFNASGNPGTNTKTNSASIRGEFAAIQAGFDKLPSLAGNANKRLAVNASATGIEAAALTAAEVAAALAVPGSSQLAPEGWQQLPSGVIIQWGFVTAALFQPSVVVDVTFPRAFPSVCWSFTAAVGVASPNYNFSSQYRTARQSVSYGIPTQTGVHGQLFVDNDTIHGRHIRWIAIGI
jgi:hypothetical protein